MRKSINTSPQVLPVPTDEALRQLADLGDVPADQREFFFESVRTSVQTAWELDGLAKNRLATLASKRGKKLVHAALTLYDTLGDLHNSERKFIEGILGDKAKFIFRRISGAGLSGLEQTAYQIALLFSLVTGKPLPREPSELPESPGRGRRSGTVKHWIFQKFVWDLLISTTTADGRLTLDKHTPKGTLVDAIRTLARHLPEGFVPRRLPGSTLQRLKDSCARTVKAVVDLEREDDRL
jgi:hypothetical protein